MPVELTNDEFLAAIILLVIVSALVGGILTWALPQLYREIRKVR